MLPDTPGSPGSRRRTPPTARPGRPPARAARTSRASRTRGNRRYETAARRAVRADIGAAGAGAPEVDARAPTGAVTVNPQLSATLRGRDQGASRVQHAVPSTLVSTRRRDRSSRRRIRESRHPSSEPDGYQTPSFTPRPANSVRSINGQGIVLKMKRDRSAALVADSSLAVDDIDGDPSGVRRRVRGNAWMSPSRPSWQPPEARRRSTPRDRAAASSPHAAAQTRRQRPVTKTRIVLIPRAYQGRRSERTRFRLGGAVVARTGAARRCADVSTWLMLATSSRRRPLPSRRPLANPRPRHGFRGTVPGVHDRSRCGARRVHVALYGESVARERLPGVRRHQHEDRRRRRGGFAVHRHVELFAAVRAAGIATK